MNSTVEYLFHSCFVVETATAVLVFDYWQDRNDRRLHRRLAETEKQIYFIVSHFHPDHYNAVILPDRAANAVGGFRFRRVPRYLLSYDVVRHRHVPADIPTAVLRPGHSYENENLLLQAYRSSDIGISCCVTVKENGTLGETFFHCGDLNNWYFAHEEGEAEQLKVSLDRMEKLFLSIVEEVQRQHAAIDHLMFPIDPRLGDDLLRGAHQWLSRITVQHFYPMHYWNMHALMLQGLQTLANEYLATTFHTPERMAEDDDAGRYLAALS